MGNGGSEVICTLPPTLESLSAVSAESRACSDCPDIAGQGEVTGAEPEGEGAPGSEVISTLPASPDSDGEVNRLLNGSVGHLPQPVCLSGGEVICTSSDGQRAVGKRSQQASIRCRRPIEFIQSYYPTPLQTNIITNGKPNRTHIQDRVNRLLQDFNKGQTSLRRLSASGNILIKSPTSVTGIPFWGFRASGILPQRLMTAVIESLAEAEAAGCRPFINPLKKAQAIANKRAQQGLPASPHGGSRSDYEVPFHIGVFKHPSQVFSQPWVTRDTLQGMSGDGPTRKMRAMKMMELCKSLDNMINGRVQRLLRDIAPDTLSKYRKFARLRASTNKIIKHDMDQQDLPDNLQRFEANRWPFLRFGNLGTTVAIGRGQSEKLHLDVHDDEELPTILMVLGKENEDWDHSDGKGDILLPTLGLAVPLYPGDIFIFYASLVPHQVKLLPAHERHKRTVATLFTCARTRTYLENGEGHCQY